MVAIAIVFVQDVDVFKAVTNEPKKIIFLGPKSEERNSDSKIRADSGSISSDNDFKYIVIFSMSLLDKEASLLNESFRVNKLFTMVEKGH
jgi:hypothetical protein